MKPSSLYSVGLRPLLYSETWARQRGVGWHRAGSDIRYYSNSRGLYSLTWTCCFPSRGDTCYLAHSYPYTYSDLQRDLLALANDPARSRYCKLRSLCHSLAGNMVYVLTITSPSARPPGQAPRKRAVVVTGRVHPGETNSSWMMKGFLEYILGGSADAQLLRDIFIFKVVPMLNPDGVIVGNYRCSLTGRDLNRNYRTVLRDAFPSVWHTRNMVKRCGHGHTQRESAGEG
uniref:Peptidase M14 domain-containing protein n=1 Tax=Callorhinchus milii TaxID=7868 RepID=A0A4W3GLS8_CALMI